MYCVWFFYLEGYRDWCWGKTWIATFRCYIDRTVNARTYQSAQCARFLSTVYAWQVFYVFLRRQHPVAPSNFLIKNLLFVYAPANSRTNIGLWTYLCTSSTFQINVKICWMRLSLINDRREVQSLQIYRLIFSEQLIRLIYYSPTTHVRIAVLRLIWYYSVCTSLWRLLFLFR